jgi:hypothetical protein
MYTNGWLPFGRYALYTISSDFLMAVDSTLE